MFYLNNALLVINIIVVILSDVSTEDNQETNNKQGEIHRQENKFDYWEIDHNEASAIYYEPADSFNVTPREFSKKFIISNPRTDRSPVYFVDKAHSTTKEKRNSFRQETETNECVNDTDTDEGTNVLLDVNLVSPSSLRNSDSKELITELLAIDDIQTTKQKLEECIDLHLFKNRHEIENWQVLLSERKIQMYSKLNETDINKEIQEICKHLEDIIDNNLAFLKHSIPRRNKFSSAETTTTKLSTGNNKHLIKEENISDFHDSTRYQTQNPQKDMFRNTEVLKVQHKPVIDNIQSEAGKNTSSEILQTGNSSIPSSDQLQAVTENYPQRRSNTFNSQSKRNRVEQKMVYKESEIKIPKLHTKELLNGSVITEANGTETLPNDDFKDFEPIKTLEENDKPILLANNFNFSETNVKKIYEETATTANADMKSALNYGTEPSPPLGYSTSFSYTLASTEKVLAQDIKHLNENSFRDLFVNISTRTLDKWSTANRTAVEVNTTSTTNKQVHETTTDKNAIVNASQAENSPSKSKKISSSSLNGTLFFDFNDKLVPTHFIQNAEGTINIAIDGKSFCDNVVKNLQSVILQAICKSDYATSNSNVPKTNKP